MDTENPSAPHPKVFSFTPTIHKDPYDYIDPTRADLSGRYVLVAGASRGLGRSMAISYAKAGASGIAISGRSSLSAVVDEMQAAAKAAGRTEPHILPMEMDVTAIKSVADCREKLQEAFKGRLDVVVANSGTLEPFISIVDSDPEIWWKTYETNVRGPYHIAHEFLPLLQRPDSMGIFLGTSSIGQHLYSPGASGYQSTKLALHRITEFIAIETAASERAGKGKSVQAFVIHPGAVVTELAMNVPKEVYHLLHDKPELCGETTVWLTSERRDWLTGRYVSVTWDMKELDSMKEEIVEKDALRMKMTF